MLSHSDRVLPVCFTANAQTKEGQWQVISSKPQARAKRDVCVVRHQVPFILGACLGPQMITG